jgi:hypothetical protein
LETLDGLATKYVGARHQQNVLGFGQFFFCVSIIKHDRSLSGAFAAPKELGREPSILDFIKDE